MNIATFTPQIHGDMILEKLFTFSNSSGAIDLTGATVEFFMSLIGNPQVRKKFTTVIPESNPVFTFNEDITNNITVLTLSSTHVLVVFKNREGKGIAILLTIADKVISSAYTLVFTNDIISFIHTAMVSADTIIIAYSNTINAGEAIVLSVTDNILTAGEVFTFEAAVATHIRVCAHSSGVVTILYRNTSGFLKSVVVTILEDNTLASSLSLVITDYSVLVFDAVMVSDSEFMLVHTNAAANGVAVLVSITETELVLNTYCVFATSLISSPSLAMLDTTKAVLAYKNVSGYGSALILAFTGVTITAYDKLPFKSALTSYINTVPLSSTSFAIIYQNENGYGEALICNASEHNYLTAGSTSVISEYPLSQVSAVKISAGEIVVCYRNHVSGGAALILNIDGGIVSPVPVIRNSVGIRNGFLVIDNPGGGVVRMPEQIADMPSGGYIFKMKLTFNATNVKTLFYGRWLIT